MPHAHSILFPVVDHHRDITHQMIHDFLDHFRHASEAFQSMTRMSADMADLQSWRPVGFAEHVATYGPVARHAYRQLPEDFRSLLEELGHELDTKGTAGLVALRRRDRTAALDALGWAEACERAGRGMAESLRRIEQALDPLASLQPRPKRPHFELVTNVLMG